MFSGEEEEGLVTGMEKDEKPTTGALLPGVWPPV